MIACVLIPRLPLRAACREGSLEGPVALAPLPGAGQAVGEVSRVAEAQGVYAGMRLSEAMARSPLLRLVPPDPARAAAVWEEVLRELEGIGAEVEAGSTGEAFFSIDGLRGLYGGDPAGVMAAAREAVHVPVRIAAAPTRFAAFAAARRGPHLPRPVSEGQAEAIVPEGALRAFLAPLPVAVLASRLEVGEREAGDFVADLKRLGIRALGSLAVLPEDKVADRFGRLGLRALRLARGEDTPLRSRDVHEDVVADIALPEGTAGPQLDRALELLVDRLLAAPERRERTVLELRLDALLCDGGSWSVSQGLGRASGSAQTICLLLLPKLDGLPGPAEALSLHATSLGAAVPEQLSLSEGGRSSRSRLARSVRELRAMQGAESLLKVIDVDARSRVPERRVVMTPYPDS